MRVISTTTIAALALIPPGAAMLTATATAAPASCLGRPATIVGTTGDDRLLGTSGPDVIVGGLGNDRIEGFDGADVICGNDGGDTMFGGAGADRIEGGPAGMSYGSDYVPNRLRGGPGADELDPGTDSRWDPETGWVVGIIDYTYEPRAVAVDLAAGTVDNGDRITYRRATQLIGSAYADTLKGGDHGDRLTGGPGNDLLSGRAGDDRLEPESPGQRSGDRDRALGGGGNDHLWSEHGRDALLGGEGDDYLGTVFPGLLDGGAGDDQLDVDVPRRDGEIGVLCGAGDDRTGVYGVTPVTASPRWRMSIDVPAERLAYGPYGTGRISGCETYDFAAVNARYRFVGSDAAEEIWADDSYEGWAGGPLVADTGGGNDFVRGARSGNDRIDLGAGTDRVNARRSSICFAWERGYCGGETRP